MTADRVCIGCGSPSSWYCTGCVQADWESNNRGRFRWRWSYATRRSAAATRVSTHHQTTTEGHTMTSDTTTACIRCGNPNEPGEQHCEPCFWAQVCDGHRSDYNYPLAGVELDYCLLCLGKPQQPYTDGDEDANRVCVDCGTRKEFGIVHRDRVLLVECDVCWNHWAPRPPYWTSSPIPAAYYGPADVEVS